MEIKSSINDYLSSNIKSIQQRRKSHEKEEKTIQNNTYKKAVDVKAKEIHKML